MSSIGIVAEYNPFHNGHAYQIDYAKRTLKAKHVIIAMSGCFTQRGTPAVLDPHTRASAALSGGADLVLQIPTVFSCASAREFAAAGVLTLYNSGFVDTILFGAESTNRAMFEAAAKASILIDSTLKSASDNFNDSDDSSDANDLNSIHEFDISDASDYFDLIRKELGEQLSAGSSFAKARSSVLEKLIQSRLPDASVDEIKSFVSSPNNILGIQYVQAIYLYAPDMHFEILSRKGNAYHDAGINDGNFASASGIRHRIYPALHGRDVSDALKKNMPPAAYELLNEAICEKHVMIYDDISMVVWQKIQDAIQNGSLSTFTDCSEDLANKIENTFAEYTTVKAYCKHKLRSKDLTFTRVNRVMAHILLGITDSITIKAKDAGYTPYILVLGVAKRSAHLLSELDRFSKVPVIIRPAAARVLLSHSPVAVDMYAIDEQADALYHAIIAAKTNIPQKNMYRMRFLIRE